MVVSVVPGKRSSENVEALVQDLKQRTGGRMMNLFVSDEYAPYKTSILNAYGETVTPLRTGKPGRPQDPYKVPPEDLKYATVHKTRENGRVVNVCNRNARKVLKDLLLFEGLGYTQHGNLLHDVLV